MKDFRKVLKEVNLAIDEIMAFDIILTSVLIFLIFYFFLMMFNLNPWYSLFPTLAYLAFLLYIDMNKNKYKIVEDKYAPLHEKLRTAADNVHLDNMVVEELEEEVTKDLSNVNVSSFVKLSRVSYKVLGSVILCLLILFASIYNMHFGDLSLVLDKADEFIRGSGGGVSDGKGNILAAGEGEGEDDIFGQQGMAALGNSETQVKIRQPSVEIIGTDENTIPDKEFEETFPDEIFAVSSGAYEEKITVENQQLVKDYFKEISK